MNLLLIIVLVLNSLVGYFLFEWAWKKMAVFRDINEERDSQFSAFRRYDGKNWKKWQFMIGAVTLMPLRILSSVLSLVVLYIAVKLLSLGHNFDKGPLGGWRGKAIAKVFQLTAYFILIFQGLRIDRRNADYEYAEYLGTDYKKQGHPKYVSTYVSNHVSWLDIICLISTVQPAFAAKDALRKIPVFGLQCKALGCIFIARGATQDIRNQVIEQIGERQTLIEKEGEYSPLVVFAEGGTSNGTCILSFKKGAFAANKSVTPVLIKYDNHSFSPAYDVTPYLPLEVFQCSQFTSKATVTILPPFSPNDYLYKTHADKGKEKWEIYAWAIRDILSKVGNLPKNEQPYRDKLKYQVILGVADEKTLKEE